MFKNVFALDQQKTQDMMSTSLSGNFPKCYKVNIHHSNVCHHNQKTNFGR